MRVVNATNPRIISARSEMCVPNVSQTAASSHWPVEERASLVLQYCGSYRGVSRTSTRFKVSNQVLLKLKLKS